MTKPYQHMEDVQKYVREITALRVDAIESAMRKNPEQFPDFAQLNKDVSVQSDLLIQKMNGDAWALEPLLRVLMGAQTELVNEAYRQGTIDGGRIYHAFVTGELPGKELEHD